ncbi:MAG: UTP--glucose-1-phosphate uridylyltransferase [Planctomycetota bacterium]|nr:MAG: UTP--glucose-1-phosphate uridylyltransferase [Planctomycetota bacterium]
MSVDLAVIPVAGLGTRLLPATKSQPKEMLPVGRKPVVQYVVEELAANGIRRSLFVTGPGKHSIENHFDIDDVLIDFLRRSGREELLPDLLFERQNMQYAYVRQRRQLGLGHAVLCAEPFVGRQPFVVALGDSIIGRHAQSRIVQRMIEVFEESDASAVIAFEHVDPEHVHHYGIARPKGDCQADVFRLDDVVEKPEPEEAPSTLAVAARYVFRPVVFDALRRTVPGKGGEIQLTDAVRDLIRAGHTVLGVNLGAGERRYDIGNFSSYFSAFIEFALTDEREGARLRSTVRELLEQLEDSSSPEAS